MHNKNSFSKDGSEVLFSSNLGFECHSILDQAEAIKAEVAACRDAPYEAYRSIEIYDRLKNFYKNFEDNSPFKSELTGIGPRSLNVAGCTRILISLKMFIDDPGSPYFKVKR